jgi:hypothetical protein
MPGARRTRSLVCESRKHTSIITTGTPNIPAFPARWFYGLLRDLLGDRAFLPPSPRNAKHCRKLTPASRRQDHTTSPSAKRALVSRARRVHRTPRPTFVTIAKRPSKGARGGRISGFDLPDGASEIFGKEREAIAQRSDCTGDAISARRARWWQKRPLEWASSLRRGPCDQFLFR